MAARKARRQKAKSTRPPGSGPARYKRKRDDAGTTTTAVADEQDDFVENQDDAFDQGHEEINLNLEGFEPQQPTPPSADEPEPPHSA